MTFEPARGARSLLVAAILAAASARAGAAPAAGELGDAAGEPAAEAAPQGEFGDAITVTAASRRRERLVDAPAAATKIDEEEIRGRHLSAELPELLAGAPGVELNRTGSAAFELNSRGLGGDFNRRLAVVVDGRDVATPLNGSYEWIHFSNLVDLTEVELVHGPGSALYGANAYNGVLSLVTRPAAGRAGGRARLAAGEPDAARADLTWAGPLARAWSAKLSASRGEEASTAVSRDRDVEYAGLPREAIPLLVDRVRFDQLGLRLDRELVEGRLLTLEAGRSRAEGTIRVAGAGRLQLGEPDERRWARLRWDAPAFRLSGYANRVEIPERRFLSFGSNAPESSENWRLQLEREDGFAAGKLRLVAGAVYGEERVDSADADGRQTLLSGEIRSDERALFAQLDVEATAALRLVAAARWDESSLYPSRFSPKLGLVWAVAPAQTLRLTYNRAFQEPNYFELYSDLPAFVAFGGGVGPTVDLGAIEAAQCAPVGIECGFATPVPARQRGNGGLVPEQVSSWELGWTLEPAGGGLVRASYYRSSLESFITESLPNPFGATNPAYGPYRPPAAHPDPAGLVAALAATLGELFPFLTQETGGAPLLVTTSVTNAARVDTQGLELELRRTFAERFEVEASYTWFDFDEVDRGVGGEIVANAPERSGALGVAYRAPRWEARARLRWVEAFRWAIGGYDAVVPSFDTLGLGARVELGERLTLGVELDNALDRRHYEVFGGDLLERRVLAAVEIAW